MTEAMRNFLCCLVAVFAALEGCSPPPGATCRRLPIDPRGNLVGSFAGGSGGGTGMAGTFSPLGIVNTTLTLTVFAPVSGCPGDEPVVNATLVDARNQLGPTPTTSVPFVGVGLGAISSTVSVLPTAPGQYTLRVAFEPSTLGVREFILDVAADGREGATTRVPIPDGAGCSLNRVWPVSDDTVACEAQSMVTVTSADGGSTTFPGAQLVVADDVLWSINATERLERRVWEDGGLQLTHSFPDFPPTPSPGMHDTDVAMRFLSNGRLTRVRVLADGGTDLLQYSLASGRPPLAYFTEDDELPWRWSLSSCSIGVCRAVSDLVALEPGFVWRALKPQGSLFGKRLHAFTRPMDDLEGNPRFSLDYLAEETASPEVPFERMPLWVEPGVGAMKVLVSISGPDLELTAWPRAEVVRVGRHHVVLADRDALTVRVVRR